MMERKQEVNREKDTAEDFSVCKTSSHIIIGQRTEKTKENPHGFWLVNNVPFDEPAILALTGSGTKERAGIDNQAGYRSANGYLSDIEKILQRGDLTQKVGLYAVIYNLGRNEYGEERFNDRIARKKLFADHHVPSYDLCLYRQHNPKFVGNKYVWQNAKGQTIEQPLDEETLSPTYVSELFEKAFLFRLCDKDGRRLSVDEACRRMRKVTVVAHCHGAYTFLKVEEKMQQKMKELGFSSDERARIQKELLCVACAPEAPLGISKSTMISFVSGEDNTLTANNNFSKFIHTEYFPASYFPDKRGEVFVAPKYINDENGKTTAGGAEHALLKYEEGVEKLRTKDWMDFFTFFSNAIVDGVKSSIDEKPLPTVKNLVCGTDEKAQITFDRMKENGKLVWQQMVRKTKAGFSAFRKYVSR